MSRREFDAATDSEANGEEEEVAHDSAESSDNDELENEEEMTGGKRSGRNWCRKTLSRWRGGIGWK